MGLGCCEGSVWLEPRAIRRRVGTQLERSMDVGSLKALNLRLMAWALFLWPWQAGGLTAGKGTVRFVF